MPPMKPDPEQTFVQLVVNHQPALRFCLDRLRPEDRMLVLNRYIGDHNLDRLEQESGRKKDSLKVGDIESSCDSGRDKERGG
jgi:hypothetical protein